jgi:hypothetical protein
MNILMTTLVLWAGLNDHASVLPETVVPQSLGMQTKTNTCSFEDLENIKDMGASFIRRGFYWTSVEKQKGIYDFSDYDKLMRDADSNGLRVLGCLFGENNLYENDGQGGIQTEEGRQGFAAFAAALADHYKGRGIIWEIWNEPNTRTFWRSNGEHNSDEFAEEYTALVKATVPAMLAVDPNCFVAAGSVSAFWEPSYYWTNACFSKGIYESGIRGWTVHPYGLKTPEEHAAGYARFRLIFINNNVPEDFPLLNSERGFSIQNLQEGWSGGPEDMALEYQAWHVVRQYMIDLMCQVQLTIWYEWKGQDFGVMDGNEQRPAYFACKNMVGELSGYSYLERLEVESPQDYLLLFGNQEGDKKIVAWTAPPPNGTPNLAVPHQVAIPVSVNGTLSSTNLYGEEISIEVTDRTIVIELSGAPKYISLPDPTHNAQLSAITWPDAPSSILQSPEWRQDTIPGFLPGQLTYSILVPEETETVPALVFTPQDINAKVSINRAKTINGPVADRTNTVLVTAQDDTTSLTYSVMVKKKCPSR